MYSFDAKKTNLGCISGTAIDDGYLYISDELSGIYSLELNVAKINNEVCNNDKINNLSKDCYEKKYVLDGYSINKCNTDGQAFVIVEQENYLYVGTSNGIMIYNKDLELQNIYKTKSAVRDMRIRDGYIYTAEGLDGISIYKIEGNSVRKISDYFLKENTRSNYCSQIGVSPNGDYIVVVCRLNCTVLLDAKDKNNIKIEKYLNSGATYYRNISQISNRIYVASASGVSELIFDNNSYIYKEINNIDYFYSTGGFTRYDDNNVLAICNKGYQLLDVSNGFENVKASDNIKLPDRILLKGVPTVSENLLVVTYTTGGEITLVDISDINNPIVLGDLLIDGIPDVACIADSGEIYIPLRHEGIMKIEKE